jgi:hypothetical protein
MNAQRPRGRWDWVWPNVDTREAAEWATKQAFWAAVVVAAITCALGLLSAFGVGFVKALGFDAGAVVDGVIFAAIAFGLWRHSRLAAWTSLVLFIAERIYAWTTAGMKNPVIPAIFILAFVGGVRGTTALHELKRTEQSRSDAI